ncbi:MAG: AMP-binding protein [Bacteroidales bacterium]
MLNFKTHHNLVALISESGERIHYSELDSLSYLFSSYFHDRKLIIVEVSNTPESIAGYAALLSSKQPMMLIDKTTLAANYDRLIHLWQPAYGWMHKDSNFNGIQKTGVEFNQYCLFTLPSNNNSYTIHPELALLLATSGSTGSGKMVRISYTNLLENTNSILGFLPISHVDRTITTLSFQHAYGLSVVNTHLVVGASIIVSSRSMVEKEFWKLVRKFDITNLNGVPFHYAMMYKLNIDVHWIPSLRFMTQAGAGLPKEMQKVFAQICHTHGARFYVMYGQTEATARIAILPSEYALTKLGSAGKAIPDVSVELYSENGTVIRASEAVGEVMVKGKTIAMGYAESYADLAKPDHWNNCLATGDLGWFDRDGFLYISGRNSRIIKLTGRRFNLDEMTNHLQQFFAQYELVCTGSDDQLFVFCERTIDLNRLSQLVAQEFDLHPTFFRIIPVERIPRSENGKILFHQLKTDANGEY